MYNDKYRNFCLWLSGYLVGLRSCEIPGIKMHIDTISKELNIVLNGFSYLSHDPFKSIEGICPHRKASNECDICNGPLCEHHFPERECKICMEEYHKNYKTYNIPNHIPGTKK